MKSTFTNQGTKGTNRYDYFEDDGYKINENQKNRSTETNESPEGDSKSKYLSDFFNKLQNKYISGPLSSKENQKEHGKITTILGLNSKGVLNMSELNKDILKLDLTDRPNTNFLDKDLSNNIDKELSKTTLGNEDDIYNSPKYPNSIEEDKKAFLLDLGLCDTDLLNSETNGLHTPNDIDYLSSNEGSDHNNFEISRLSVITQGNPKNLGKISTSNGVSASTLNDKNSKPKISVEKLANKKDFHTNIEDTLAGNRNNLRNSNTLLPAKLNGREANRTKTIQSLAISVQKLQEVAKSNPSTNNIVKQSSRDSHVMTDTSYVWDRTTKTHYKNSNKIEDKLKPKLDLSQPRHSNLVNNNTNKKSQSQLDKTNISERDKLEIENLKYNNTQQKDPIVMKSPKAPVDNKKIFKSDGRNSSNSRPVYDNPKIDNSAVINQFLYSNKDDEIDFNLNKRFVLSGNIEQYDDLITELEGIFGKNLENFNENILFSTLEDFDSKNLIRSLIFLSFEQKKLLKNMNTEMTSIKEQLKEKEQQLEKERTEVKLSVQRKLTDKSDNSLKQLNKDMCESKTFISNDKYNSTNLYSKMKTNDISRININESRIIPLSKVNYVRSSSVVGRLPPKKSKVMNTTFIEDVKVVKKNTRVALNKYI